uniref:Nuclear receptor domain-containing protein n=1 Tax=Panagrolaimus sp. JU765 TaxID=591449 RepID=A0AC34QUS7_9BILA
MTDNLTEIKECLICGGKSNGLHFGAEACRACAAFFRRTVAMQLSYQCRTNGKCKIKKEYRCLCRFCRYEKCIKSGMKPSSVQINKYDPLPSIKTDAPHETNSKNCTTSVIQQIPSESCSPTSSTVSPNLNNVSESEKYDLAMANIFNRMNFVELQQMSLMSSMTMSYKRMMERQKIYQRANLLQNDSINNFANIFNP